MLVKELKEYVQSLCRTCSSFLFEQSLFKVEHNTPKALATDSTIFATLQCVFFLLAMRSFLLRGYMGSCAFRSSVFFYAPGASF